MSARPSPSSSPLAMRASITGTVLISIGAFWLSFTALVDLAQRAGLPASSAWIWPLIVDGVILVATCTIIAGARGPLRDVAFAWALLFGATATSTTANAMHAVVYASRDVPGAVAVFVACVPPLVLVSITHLSVTLLARSPVRAVRARRSTRALKPAPTAAAHERVRTPVVSTGVSTPARPVSAAPRVDMSELEAWVQVRSAAGERVSGALVGERLGVSPATGRRYLAKIRHPV